MSSIKTLGRWPFVVAGSTGLTRRNIWWLWRTCVTKELLIPIRPSAILRAATRPSSSTLFFWDRHARKSLAAELTINPLYFESSRLLCQIFHGDQLRDHLQSFLLTILLSSLMNDTKHSCCPLFLAALVSTLEISREKTGLYSGMTICLLIWSESVWHQIIVSVLVCLGQALISDQYRHHPLYQLM